MARILIVEGSQRGALLAGALVREGHAVRVVARDLDARERVRAVGAESWSGSPERLASLRGALEHVTIACWLLADADGDRELARAFHGSLLESFLTMAIDSTLRGFLYEAAGSSLDGELLAHGRTLVSETGARNSLPVAMLTAEPLDLDAWLAAAMDGVRGLLQG